MIFLLPLAVGLAAVKSAIGIVRRHRRRSAPRLISDSPDTQSVADVADVDSSSQVNSIISETPSSGLGASAGCLEDADIPPAPASLDTSEDHLEVASVSTSTSGLHAPAPEITSVSPGGVELPATKGRFKLRATAREFVPSSASAHSSVALELSTSKPAPSYPPGHNSPGSDSNIYSTVERSAQIESPTQRIQEENTQGSVPPEVASSATQDFGIYTAPTQYGRQTTQSAFESAALPTEFLCGVQEYFAPTGVVSYNPMAQTIDALAVTSGYAPGMNYMYQATFPYSSTSAASSSYMPHVPPPYPMEAQHGASVPPMYPSAEPSQLAPHTVHGFQSAAPNTFAPAPQMSNALFGQPLYPSGVSYGEEIATPQRYQPAVPLQQISSEVPTPIQTPQVQSEGVRAPDPCDDPSLGEFNGAGLSNQDYKIKVADLLASNNPLPPLEIIAKNKRLFRALPSGKRSAVKRWIRAHSDSDI